LARKARAGALGWFIVFAACGQVPGGLAHVVRPRRGQPLHYGRRRAGHGSRHDRRCV